MCLNCLAVKALACGFYVNVEFIGSNPTHHDNFEVKSFDTSAL
jgi:hypothetical protein